MRRAWKPCRRLEKGAKREGCDQSQDAFGNAAMHPLKTMKRTEFRRCQVDRRRAVHRKGVAVAWTSCFSSRRSLTTTSRSPVHRSPKDIKVQRRSRQVSDPRPPPMPAAALELKKRREVVHQRRLYAPRRLSQRRRTRWLRSNARSRSASMSSRWTSTYPRRAADRRARYTASARAGPSRVGATSTSRMRSARRRLGLRRPRWLAPFAGKASRSGVPEILAAKALAARRHVDVKSDRAACDVLTSCWISRARQARRRSRHARQLSYRTLMPRGPRLRRRDRALAGRDRSLISLPGVCAASCRYTGTARRFRRTRAQTVSIARRSSRSATSSSRGRLLDERRSRGSRAAAPLGADGIMTKRSRAIRPLFHPTP